MMAPGPVVYSDDVLRMCGTQSLSHRSPQFLVEFPKLAHQLRVVFGSNREDEEEVFTLSGSGTLGYDLALRNVFSERRHRKVLVLTTGKFGERWETCASAAGLEVVAVRSRIIGHSVDMDDVAAALKLHPDIEALLCVHVETTTGAVLDMERIAGLARLLCPQALLIVDAMGSIAAQPFRMTEWGIDFCFANSQKSLGVPPGLIVAFASRRYLGRLNCPDHYLDLRNWLPVYRAFRKGETGYFATPNINLIRALHVSLTQLLEHGEEGLFAAHRRAAAAFRSAVCAFGLELLSQCNSSSLTVISFFSGPIERGCGAAAVPKVMAARVVEQLMQEGIQVAPGAQVDVAHGTIRIGHTACTVLHRDGRERLRKTIDTLETVLLRLQVVHSAYVRGEALSAFDKLWPDELNAFCSENPIRPIPVPSATGVLHGLSFAIKDIFDVAGCKTGFGSPAWLASHEAAAKTAPVVQQLLSAGARLIGDRTRMDELAWSLSGENVHYGMPINPAASGCCPGGSSSGSAAVTAAGWVDFALGTDTAGSVRLPASYCGVLGWRPTHGRLSTEGVCPLAASFDTCGVFANDASVLERVAHVLLDGPEEADLCVGRLLVARDAFDVLEEGQAPGLTAAIDRVRRVLGRDRAEEVCVSEGSQMTLLEWAQVSSACSAKEAAAGLGSWISAHEPALGPQAQARLAFAASVTEEALSAAKSKRLAISQHLRALLQDNALLLLPSSPGEALPRDADADAVVVRRNQALPLLCLAGLAGLPQISLPLARGKNGHPLGLSIVAAPGNDALLLRLAASLMGDEGAVRLAWSAFVEAFNRGDAAACAGLYAPDGDRKDSVSGKIFRGEDAIRLSYEGLFGGRYEGGTLVAQIEQLRFVTETVALLDIVSEVRSAASTPLRASTVFVKLNGVWLISAHRPSLR